MALSRARRDQGLNYWPGFVDALSTLLLVIIFLLSVFMMAQFFLSREVTGRDSALTRLNSQVQELTQLLALERAGKSEVKGNIDILKSTLDKSEQERGRLRGLIEAEKGSTAEAAGAAGKADKALQSQKDITARALAQVDILNQQIAALRRQLAAIEQALNASGARDKESQTKIAELGSRLNVALAQKVQELARYRSDFFGRLREILGNQPGIRIVGDRFVFQSEVLFNRGEAGVNPDGRADLDKIASAIVDLEREIPPEIPWILRVDGHTDKKAMHSDRYPTNWELSSARAIAVVQYLITKGVSANRLAAAGFGQFQPLDGGDDDAALRKNRRIELKLTER